jgi:acyl-CoA dehydrogenase
MACQTPRAATRRGSGRAPSATETEYVISGHKWFSSNGSITDFLIVMAVTDPDARPHQRASMFIVDSDTPGVNIVRDVATMEHAQDEFGKLGGHAEILY